MCYSVESSSYTKGKSIKSQKICSEFMSIMENSFLQLPRQNKVGET